jgi:hypothetical protein
VTLQTAVPITAAGVLAATYTPGSTDTITGADIGDRGCILEVNNGSGGSINVTIADPGYTPGGNQATSFPVVAVAAAAKKRIKIPPAAVNNTVSPATASVAFSATASVTCELYRL